MKHIVVILSILTSIFSFSQEENKEQLLALKKANNFVYEGNELIADEDFVSAEMEYRKAISEQATTVAGAYNLGTSYYKSGNLDESLYRLQQATETATSKSEKHKAFHNIGNILMQNKKCKEAVEAYKNALRNNPSDDETRYNLALAQKMLKNQQDQNKDNKDKDKDKKEDNKDQNKKDQDKKDQDQDKENNDQVKEKILSFIVNCLVPFGPVIVKLDPSILIDESFGIDMFFFPILDIKIPYKLFHHQYYFS